MKTLTPVKESRISGMDEGPSPRMRYTGIAESLYWWQRLLRALASKVNVPFLSDWEKKTGLHWKEWGKL